MIVTAITVITMYKERDDIVTFPKAEPNESSLNRIDR